MATYDYPDNEEIKAGKAVKATTTRKVRDNIVAVAEGASGAPHISVKAQRFSVYGSSGNFLIPSGVMEVWVEVGGGRTETSSFGAYCSATGGTLAQVYYRSGFGAAGQHGNGIGGQLNITGKGAQGNNGGGASTGIGGGVYVISSMSTPDGNGGLAYGKYPVTAGENIPVTVGAGGWVKVWY